MSRILSLRLTHAMHALTSKKQCHFSSQSVTYLVFFIDEPQKDHFLFPGHVFL